jgi:hypothetical protein
MLADNECEGAIYAEWRVSRLMLDGGRNSAMRAAPPFFAKPIPGYGFCRNQRNAGYGRNMLLPTHDGLWFPIPADRGALRRGAPAAPAVAIQNGKCSQLPLSSNTQNACAEQDLFYPVIDIVSGDGIIHPHSPCLSHQARSDNQRDKHHHDRKHFTWPFEFKTNLFCLQSVAAVSVRTRLWQAPCTTTLTCDRRADS